MAIARIIADLSAWSAARATSRTLGRLTRHELADIGLHAGDIEIPTLLRRA